MKNFSVILASLLLVTACGGGGDETVPTTPDTTPVVVAPATPAPVAATEATPIPVPEAPQLATDAPLNNLDLATNANYLTTAATTTCGYSLASKTLTGVVTSVHDGDTIEVGDTSVRLEAIDAPELTQAYGKQSRDNLAALVLNKTVTVYYAKLDKYGRTVGSVITPSCVYANLQQVRSGSAWHYKQYQCEQPASLRSDFAAAQAAAEAADLGLWATVATPPWVFRNGVDPTPPTCSSDSASWYRAPAAIVPTPVLPTTPVVLPGSGSGTSTYVPTNSCFRVWVNGYRRSNGTYVKGYYRNSPGCA